MDRAAAFAIDRTAIVMLLKDLNEREWAAPSNCVGWAVRDVVSHMAAACHGTFTPWVLKLITGKDVEAANNRDAAKRSSWEPTRLLREYDSWSKRCVPVMGLVQKKGVRALPIRVAEVGTYPAALLTSAFVFDHGLHARHDIAAALGRTMPAQDAGALAVSLEWMMAGLPTMSGDRLGWVDAPIELRLVGTGGDTWTIAPGDKRVKVTKGATNAAVASIEGSAADFPVWGTGRRPWRETDIAIKGDQEIGTHLLDTMRII